MHILRNTAHNNKELLKLGFSATVVLVCIWLHHTVYNIYLIKQKYQIYKCENKRGQILINKFDEQHEIGLFAIVSTLSKQINNHIIIIIH